jgi:methanethiol oxidase
MSIWRPDPSFYPSPRMAMQAPREKLAYVTVLNPDAALNLNGGGRPDALAVFDVDPDSETYSQVVGRLDLPNTGDELHHFGWNACSSALCPYAPHPHIERRYLIVPGIRSSRVYIIDVKTDPREPQIVKVIEPEELSNVRATAAPTPSTAARRAST